MGNMRELCIKKLSRTAQDMEKSNKMWDKRAKEFAMNIKHQSADYFMEFIKKQISISDRHFVDIGSGAGKYIKLLLDEGASVDAVEPSSEMVIEARKHLLECGYEESCYRIFNLPFQEFEPIQKYDYVLLANSPVISFYENYKKILDLATKGIFITSGIGSRDSLLERVSNELNRKPNGHNGQAIRYVFELLLEDGYFPIFETKLHRFEEKINPNTLYQRYASWFFGEEYEARHVEQIQKIIEKEMEYDGVFVKKAIAQAFLYVDLSQRLSE